MPDRRNYCHSGILIKIQAEICGNGNKWKQMEENEINGNNWK
jgi:hypothetical protein